MMRITGLVGVIVGLGACFKPAMEREVVEDGDAVGETEVSADSTEGEVDGLEVVETVDTEVSETVGCEGANGEACDDGDPCTRDDRCGSGGCEGIPYVCDDGLSCTEDRCDGVGGCGYPVAGGACLIGGACFAAGEVKADDPCRVCAGGQAWSPNDGGVCEDGDTVCTLDDRCEGLVCVGGPRPSDATTDWALRPLTPRPPSSAIVWGVGRAAIRDALIVVAAKGPTEYSDNTGEVSLLGDSVAVLRRTQEGGLVSPLVYDGFDKAEVAAFAQPDLATNRYALAVELEGEGRVLRFGAATPLEASEPLTQLVVGESDGQAVWTADWPRTVHAVGLDDNVDMLVAGDYFGVLSFPELGGAVSTLASGSYVVEVGSSGTASWAVTFKGQQGVTGRPKICPLGGHAAVVSTTFEQALSVESTGRGPLEVTGDAQATPAFIWIGQSGSAVVVSTPFKWNSVPQLGGAAGPGLVDCTSDWVLLSIKGRLDAGSPIDGRYSVDGSAAGATLIKLARDGAILWAITFEEAEVGLNEPTVKTLGEDLVVVWAKSNFVPGAILDAVGSRFELTSESFSGAAYFTLDGEFRSNHYLGKVGAPAIISAEILPGGTILLGGTALYVDSSISGADGDLEIEATADGTPFVVGVGTNRGLFCAAHP